MKKRRPCICTLDAWPLHMESTSFKVVSLKIWNLQEYRRFIKNDATRHFFGSSHYFHSSVCHKMEMHNFKLHSDKNLKAQTERNFIVMTLVFIKSYLMGTEKSIAFDFQHCCFQRDQAFPIIPNDGHPYSCISSVDCIRKSTCTVVMPPSPVTSSRPTTVPSCPSNDISFIKGGFASNVKLT